MFTLFHYDLYNIPKRRRNIYAYLFFYFADRASQYIYHNINHLDALNFIMSLFHASTCFEHMCSSSGGQNCSQPMHGTATYRCGDTRGCIIQFWPPDDEQMCSKHVEAWNKLIVKKFCASSCLIAKINTCLCLIPSELLIFP